MPGQRKRRRHQEEEARRAAERFAPAQGRWEVIFSTQDEAQWQERLRVLRATDTRIDWSAVRIDILCGRVVQPTTYQLSRFVPAADTGQGQDAFEH
ncbi:hypothetical protein OG689_32915 [Kitasatospora sp. NBC_00240]|uniref:hypothetical protein n=1 Tax=Kitasatospora sp. NBC_00240 TaxID=2903567 RepID=UPI00225176E9|nr:hypothetical protein [Kitasatospora sp. NBC_00240]MCX5214012.1 hypothetical protein [Kitasatospora sp. NBC_00240]